MRNPADSLFQLWNRCSTWDNHLSSQTRLYVVNPEINEVCIGLLQTLYVNKVRAPGFPAIRLANALGFEEDDVKKGLDEMADKGLVERVDEGYRISEEGYLMVQQRETNKCPFL